MDNGALSAGRETVASGWIIWSGKDKQGKIIKFNDSIGVFCT
jgi:hypothetical protein